ncbi:hypothetical protein CEXT_692671 [Caerostris extrusa]|uniref:Uncharacterized protein n=1 Tax=Caerostris extrusa TaxID=172846 RepID=A0AAV4QJB5_CAEEX|nr:hypothetical protein CEXT_692671 [Caerostris extrusa]
MVARIQEAYRHENLLERGSEKYCPLLQIERPFLAQCLNEHWHLSRGISSPNPVSFRAKQIACVTVFILAANENESEMHKSLSDRMFL